jgi:hypothetical protein
MRSEIRVLELVDVNSSDYFFVLLGRALVCVFSFHVA